MLTYITQGRMESKALNSLKHSQTFQDLMSADLLQPISGGSVQTNE